MKLTIPKIGEVWQCSNFFEKIISKTSIYFHTIEIGINGQDTSNDLSFTLSHLYKDMINNKYRKVIGV